MSKTKITIALPKGGLLAAAAMKREKDVAVSPDEAIDVPEAYGLSLIDNSFAYRAEKAKASPVEKPKTSRPAEEPNAAAIVAAEKAVEDAKAKLADAGDDLVAKAAAEEAVKAAEDALAALKA